MEIKGLQSIPAPRQAVWDALNDPAVLQRCLPGCEAVERVDATSYKVVVGAAIGPLRARFQGALRLTDAEAPASCVMVFEGQGGAVGFGKGAAKVELRETGETTTELSYSASAQVGGKLAQVGSRLIESVARKMSDDFFRAFVKPFEAGAPADEAAPEPAASFAVESPVAASPVAVASTPPAVAAATAKPVDVRAPSSPPLAPLPRPTPALVPAWWLAIAALLGSVTTLAGALIHH